MDRLRQAAALHLDACLLADTLDARGARSVERRVERDGSRREARHRIELPRDQGLSLASGDARHQREMVVVPSSLHAQLRPAADGAVLDRLRVRRRWRVGGHCGRRDIGPEHCRLEARLGRSVVGEVVVDAQLGRLPRAPAEHDLHELRPNALDALELLDVGADLEHGAGLDVARQLRVGDLVVVRPPDRWTLARPPPAAGSRHSRAIGRRRRWPGR